MKPATISAGVVAWVGAALSSLCCLLPLAVIALGLGSGAFMAGKNAPSSFPHQAGHHRSWRCSSLSSSRTPRTATAAEE